MGLAKYHITNYIGNDVRHLPDPPHNLSLYYIIFFPARIKH